MTTATAISPDGLFKITVDAFKIGLLFYNALGATTKAYSRKGTGAGWEPQRVDAISAYAALGSSKYPGATSALPPNIRRNDSEADSRAWWVGLVYKYKASDSSSSVGSMDIIADLVTASGSATWKGVTLQAGPIEQRKEQS